MKKKNTLIKIVTAFTAFTVGASLLTNVFVKYKELDATPHVGNFDPYTYSGNYYNNIHFDYSDGMEGELRKEITSLIKPTNFFIYTGGSGSNYLSTQLQYCDADPTNSSNMIYLYTRDSVRKNAAVSWNREHVWPQSLSNGNWGQDKGGTDLLHIRPTYSGANSGRNNRLYADLGHKTEKTCEGMPYGYITGNYFEPLDATKGDVARIIMYLWTAYKDYPGYSPLNILGVFESYDTLLKWHTNDKPDILEGNRNNYVQSTKQGNRNPFVDHPELAWRFFGDKASVSIKNACMEAYPVDGYTPDPSGDDPEPTITSYTLDGTITGGTNGYATDSEITQNDVTWMVTGNTQQSPWRIGGKSLSNVDRSIYSTTALPFNTDRIDIELGTNAGVTVNSMNVGVYSTADKAAAGGTGDVANFTPTYSASNTISLRKTGSTSWKNCYYNITFNVSVSGTDNKYFQFKSALFAQSTDPTAIEVYPNNSSIIKGDTVALTSTLTPSNAVATVSWKSSNENVATVNNGVVTGVGAGSATIIGYVDTDENGVIDSNELRDQCTVTVSTPNPLDEVINLNYSNLTGTGTRIEADDALEKIGGNNGNMISVTPSYVYDGNGSGGGFENTAGLLKTGTTSYASQIKFVLDGEATRVDITCHDFDIKSEDKLTNNNTISVNGSATQLAPFNEEGLFETLTFQLDNPDNVITIDINKRVLIKNIRISYLDPDATPVIEDYLNFAETQVILEATEEPASETHNESIDFSALGLENSIQYDDPFKPTENSPILVTFTNSKYYDSGTAIRVYGGSTITITSESENIKNVQFTWTGGSSYKPESSEVVNVGTYDVSTSTWEGSAKSITLTRPSGSGHWRLKSITITYGGDIALSGISLQFGAKIAKVDWDDIAEEWGIADYGVMLFRTTPEYFDVVPSVEDYYRADNPVAVFRRNAGVAPENEDGFYTFTARVKITSDANYSMVFCAASFIMTTDGQYHFFCETKKSVNMIASQYKASGESQLSNAALNILAGNN